MVSLPAYRCTGCGTVSQPRRARCRQCGRTDVEQVELRRGKLLTFTRVTATRPGYPSPMILCLAEFEYGVKLVAQVDDSSPELEMEVLTKVLGALAERTDQHDDVVLVGSPIVVVLLH